MSALIEAVKLSRSFGEVVAVHGVTLNLQQGEFVVITGASGSGKTTLLELLGGLDRPTSGTVNLMGTDLGPTSSEGLAALRRSHFGFVFQDFRLVAHLSARDNARLACLVGGGASVARAETAARADALLARVGLADCAARRPSQLSRGEMQRVALARALAHRPAVVFADEPTASLDPASRALVWNLLGELNRDEGVAILAASHDAQPPGARRLHLEDGRLTEN